MGLSTASSTYVPQPGTIPARVVAFLATLPPGGEVQTGVLCDALEQPSSSIISSCRLAIDTLLVTAEKREGRLFWRRGPNAPKVALTDMGPYVAPAPRVRKPAPAPAERITISTPRPTTVNQMLESVGSPAIVLPPQPNPAPPAEPVAAPAPPPAAPITAESGAACAAPAPACQNGTPAALTPPAPMRCAVWSDGTLAIQKDGQTQTYTPDETRAIVRYLERVLVGEGAE